jgi:hypothetical protein
VPNCFGYLLIFVDVGENSVMADDVAILSNPPVALVEQEEFEETPLDMNISQWLHEEESGWHSSRSFGMGLLIVS